MPSLPEVAPGILDRIQQQVGAERRSQGGILLGTLEEDRLTVVNAVPDPRAGVHDGEITFSTEIWEDVYASLGREHPEAKVVGWYHSHPQGDAGLTDYDRSLHASMFSDPAMVALVISPRTKQQLWYGWSIGQLTGMDEPVPVIVQQGWSPGRRRLALAGAALGILVAGVGGFGVGTSVDRGPAGGPNLSSELAAARSEASAFRERAASLQQQLDGARTQVQAAQSRVEEIQGEVDSTRAMLAEAQASLAAVRQELKQVKAGTVDGETFVYRYTVKPGDTMWDLSIFFYGTPAAWPRIAEPSGIENPNLILVGQQLEVPLKGAPQA